MEKFLLNEEGIDCYRTICKERAKRTLGDPWPPIYFNPEYRETKYKSLLSPTFGTGKLKIVDDAEFYQDKNDLDGNLTGLDLLGKQMHYFKLQNKELYDERWSKASSQMTYILQLESNKIELSNDKEFFKSNHGRNKIYLEAMSRLVDKLAFSSKSKLSLSNNAAYVRPINELWSLYIYRGENVRFYDRHVGELFLKVEIRPNDCKNLKRYEIGRVLQVRYSAIVPGFFEAYRKFRSGKELRRVIEAHIALISLIYDDVIMAAKSVL